MRAPSLEGSESDRALPAPDAAGDHDEQRVLRRAARAPRAAPGGGVAEAQLPQQVRPFVGELAAGLAKAATQAAAANLRGVEPIAAPARLLEDPREVRVHGSDRIARREKPLELRVV